MARRRSRRQLYSSPSLPPSRITKSRNNNARVRYTEAGERRRFLAEMRSDNGGSTAAVSQNTVNHGHAQDSSDVMSDNGADVQMTMDGDEQIASERGRRTHRIAHSMDEDETPFPIMDLPTEIRLEIYRACLTRPYNILLSKKEQLPQPEPTPAKLYDSSAAAASESDPEADEVVPANVPDNGNPSGMMRPFIPSRRRSSIAAGLRGLAARSTRPIRLLTGRSSSASRATTALETRAGSSRDAAGANDGSNHYSAPSRPRRRISSSRVVISAVESPRRPQSQDPLLVNLLLVSKEVYKEARSVLYSENLFTLDLSTAMSTLECLHQRSRRQIKHVELEIPTYNEILERFQETVRLSLRYCSGLQKFVVHMPFTLPGADGSGTTGNTTVYANGFDILRWLPQQCNVILQGNACTEIEIVVNKHLHLAKTLDKLAYARRQHISNDTGPASLVPAAQNTRC